MQGNLFHTGFVVPQLEPAMAQFSEVVDISWSEIVERRASVTGLGGALIADMRFVAGTLGGPPYIELLEPVPGTAWEVPTFADGSLDSAHHLAVWSHDLVAESRRLVGLGYPRLLTFDDDSGEATRFAYHRLPGGPIIELCDAKLRGQIEGYFTGSGYPESLSGPPA